MTKPKEKGLYPNALSPERAIQEGLSPQDESKKQAGLTEEEMLQLELDKRQKC
jgi:hypothetical protein